MKILSVMSLVLSVALLAGIALLVLEMTDLGDRIGELEANRSKDMSQRSKDTSTAFTRIGELDTEIRALSKQMDAMATKGLDASVGDLIETKLAEKEARKREEQAQQRRDWQARREEREFNKLIEALQLNDETKEKMKGVLAQSREDRREFFIRLRNEDNIDRDKILEGMQKISNEADESVKNILSEEQFKKYQEVQTKNRQRWGNIGGGHRH